MSKILVAYFSVSEKTKKVADKLAEPVETDVFEINPEISYTDKDLDWKDNKSKSSVEMNDTSSRPRIISKFNDMTRYDIIFVGFLIW